MVQNIMERSKKSKWNAKIQIISHNKLSQSHYYRVQMPRKPTRTVIVSALVPPNFSSWEMSIMWRPMSQCRNWFSFLPAHLHQFSQMIHILPISHISLWHDANNLLTNKCNKSDISPPSAVVCMSISQQWTVTGVVLDYSVVMSWKEETKLSSDNAHV
jgi:hypothetical protein